MERLAEPRHSALNHSEFYLVNVGRGAAKNHPRTRHTEYFISLAGIDMALLGLNRRVATWSAFILASS